MNQELYHQVQWDATIAVLTAVAATAIGAIAITTTLTIARERLQRRRKRNRRVKVHSAFYERPVGKLKRPIEKPELGDWRG